MQKNQSDRRGAWAARPIVAAGVLALTLLSNSAMADRDCRRDDPRCHEPSGWRDSDRGPRGDRRYDYLPDPRSYDRPRRPERLTPDDRDLDRYRHNYRVERPYHIGRYYAPRGERYYAYRYGDRLPSVFWGDAYLIGDFWLFGLAVPPSGYIWVRYWGDAILIDRRNGVVLQVVYGLYD
jgi:Ni/Co efflux regulator RcnB